MLLPLAAHAADLPIDWPAAATEAVDVLSRYLQVDTTNPPGNETAGARFLAGELEKAGITSEIVEFAPGRGSLIARLDGADEAPPLCMLSHIDVVTAEPTRWKHAPLSGTVADGAVWGRGALDMKGMGAIELLTLIHLKRLGIPLKRDVVLLAVADEEVDGKGAEQVAKMWDRVGCSHLVNEGGLGLRDVFFEGQGLYAISVGEKGALWVRMVATGMPGHGSTPVPGRAPEVLRRALDLLAEREPALTWSPALMETFRRSGAHHGGLAGGLLQRRGLVKLMLKKRLMGKPPTAAVLTNTVNVTGLGGANQPNVVPSEVWAVLDCRLLPGVQPTDMLAELRGIVADPAVRFEVIDQKVGNTSPWEDPLFEALARRAVEGRPDAVAGPVLSVGYTDSITFRPLGVHAYGFVPFMVSGDEMGTMHGDDERVSVEELGRGLKILLQAVADVST
jgi:acetylornithine deacetylase/succinyl-diaminopimelate desuccinylase-like protein